MTNDVEPLAYKNNWALALMSKGLIVKLSVSRWRGAERLSPNDLGINFENQQIKDFFDEYISLGSNKLLPKEVESVLVTIESQARENLKNHGFKTIWGWFVPFTSFEQWEKKNEQIRHNYFSVAEKIGEQYNNIVSAIKEEYKKMAVNVWYRKFPNQGEPPISYVETFSQNIVDKIPGRNELVSSFKYRTMYNIIPMPSVLEKDIHNTEKIMQEREISQMDTEYKRQALAKIHQQYTEKKQELIDDFLNSTVGFIRNQIKELCLNVLASIRGKNNKITKSNSNKIKNLIKRVSLLNFYDEKEISLLLNIINEEIDKSSTYRDMDVIVSTMEKIVDTTSKNIHEIAGNDNSTIDIDLS